jgi:hypothetical protein
MEIFVVPCLFAETDTDTDTDADTDTDSTPRRD